MGIQYIPRGIEGGVGKFDLSATPIVVNSNQHNFVANFTKPTLINTTSNANVTGIVAGVNGQVVRLVNTGPARLRIRAESSGSIPANRFMYQGDTANIRAGGIATFVYSTLVNRWLRVD